MAEAQTLHDAFIDELRDTYDAEKQLTKALPAMAKAANSEELRAAFEDHLEQTRGQIERLEAVFESIDEKARGKHCEGMAGIIAEGKSIMEEDFDEATTDATLIAAGQRAEHYEMAAYGTLIAWARALGHAEAADLLQETQRRRHGGQGWRRVQNTNSARARQVRPSCRTTGWRSGTLPGSSYSRSNRLSTLKVRLAPATGRRVDSVPLSTPKPAAGPRRA